MLCYQKDYPRPQFVRKDWTSLNGVWGFDFDDDNKGEKEGWYQDFPGEKEIHVPFTYETKKSSIHDEGVHHFVWYRRQFEADQEKLAGKKLFLHFEGSDFLTKVWINGQFLGMHEGGYSRFSFDVTPLVTTGENFVVVKAEDSLDPQQPRGKTAVDFGKFRLLVCSDNRDMENCLAGICTGYQFTFRENDPQLCRGQTGTGIFGGLSRCLGRKKAGDRGRSKL